MLKLVDITWERVNIHLVFSKNIEDANLYLKKDKKIIAIGKKKQDEATLNVTNILDGKMLDEGNWEIIADGENVGIDSALLKKLDSLTRVFRYRNFYAYIVSLALNNEGNAIIESHYYMQNRHYKRHIRLIEGANLGEKVRLGMMIFLSGCLNLAYRFLTLILSRKYVLFFNENSDKLQDNMQILYDYLKPRHQDLKVFAHNKFNSPKNPFIYLFEIKLLAQSKVIIIDNYTPLLSLIKISPKTKVIQLWHAGVGFKAVGYARFGKPGSPHPYFSGHRRYDVAIVNEDELIDIYEEVFGIARQKIKAYGMPRLMNYQDMTHIKQTANQLYAFNPELQTKKIILFAPTYRGEGQEDAFYDYDQIDLNQLYRFCQKNNFLFIIKEHPFIKKKIVIPKTYQDLIKDYSHLAINDLIYIADILITDYSSCAYEYSFFKKPLIFFRYDADYYEYYRPLHTLDVFCKEQYCVTDFKALMQTLDQLKDVDPKKRFKLAKKGTNPNVCDIIEKEIYIGE